MEHTPVINNSPEATATLPENLDFLNVDAIKAYRAEEAQQVAQAGNAAIAATPDDDPFRSAQRKARNEARARATASLDTEAESHVAKFVDPAEHPQLYSDLSDLLKSVSIKNMSREKWAMGDKDITGKRNRPETSGQSMLERKLEEIRAKHGIKDRETEEDEEPDETEEAPDTTAEREAIKVELAKARAALADISLKRRRTHKGGWKDKEYHEEYNAADKRYHEAFQKLTVLNANSWKAQGSTQQEVHAKGMFTLKEEMTAFALAEKAIVSGQGTRKDRFMHWLAKRGALEGTSAVVGFAAGYGLKSIGAALLGIGAGVTIPALMAVGSAKAVLGARVHQIRTLDKRHAEDKEKLNEVINTEHYSAVTHEDLAGVTSSRLRGIIDGRIAEDRRLNRNRVIRAATIGGGAALLGAGLAEWNSSDHTSVWPFGEHSGTGSSTGDTNPNGGSGGGSGAEGANGGGSSGAEGQAADGIAKAAHTETLNPNMVDGYDTNVVVESGHGYQREIIELLQEKNQHLSSDDSWNLYLHLQDKFPNGNFFTDNASYKMNDGYFGISHPGGSHWNPAVIHEINRWMAENASKVTTS